MAAFSRDFSIYERKENARENPAAKHPQNIPRWEFVRCETFRSKIDVVPKLTAYYLLPEGSFRYLRLPSATKAEAAR